MKMMHQSSCHPTLFHNQSSPATTQTMCASHGVWLWVKEAWNIKECKAFVECTMIIAAWHGSTTCSSIEWSFSQSIARSTQRKMHFPMDDSWLILFGVCSLLSLAIERSLRHQWEVFWAQLIYTVWISMICVWLVAFYFPHCKSALERNSPLTSSIRGSNCIPHYWPLFRRLSTRRTVLHTKD